MIQCELFNVEVQLLPGEERALVVTLRTDLPSGTVCGVAIERRYSSLEGMACVWALVEETVLVQSSREGEPNGFSSRFKIDEGDEAAQVEFEELSASDTPDIAGPVSDEISITVLVPIRQRLKEFGKNNVNLDGTLVREANGMRTIEVVRTLVCPMGKEFEPTRLR